MFSLIITIVSIALVVALVAATMYYGGDTLTQGRDRADAAAFVSGGQQISGSIQLYRALEGELPSDLDDLTGEDGKYLTSLPQVKGTGTWTLGDATDRVVTIGVLAESVCQAIQAQNGGDDDEISGSQPTAQTTGCYGTEGDYTFFYKY